MKVRQSCKYSRILKESDYDDQPETLNDGKKTKKRTPPAKKVKTSGGKQTEKSAEEVSASKTEKEEKNRKLIGSKKIESAGKPGQSKGLLTAKVIIFIPSLYIT